MRTILYIFMYFFHLKIEIELINFLFFSYSHSVEQNASRQWIKKKWKDFKQFTWGWKAGDCRVWDALEWYSCSGGQVTRLTPAIKINYITI